MRKHLISFIFLFFAINGQAKELKRKFGNYEIVIQEDSVSTPGILKIFQNKTMIYSEVELGHHFLFGDSSNPFTNQNGNYFGNDLNNNGIPDFVITHWSAGMHCCFYLRIYELGERFHRLIEVDGGSNGIHLKDLNDDGSFEIEYWDPTLDYAFGSFAESAQGRVVLEFKDGTYQPSCESMLKPLREAQQTMTRVPSIRARFKNLMRVPKELIEPMVDLSYSGHYGLARELARRSWILSPVELTAFLEKFGQRLYESKTWRRFNQACLNTSSSMH